MPAAPRIARSRTQAAKVEPRVWAALLDDVVRQVAFVASVSTVSGPPSSQPDGVALSSDGISWIVADAMVEGTRPAALRQPPR